MFHNKSGLGDASLSSTTENEDSMRQRYSITPHPSLPVLLCSDGYLVCVLRVQTAFATQSRLIRELMHETIGLLNMVSETIDSDYRLNDILRVGDNESANKGMIVNSKLENRGSFSSNENLPVWGLHTDTVNVKIDKSGSGTDSGVDSTEGRKSKSGARDGKGKEAAQKIAEGKIIFSFLPQIEPLSHETIETSSVAHKIETAFEYLQSSWTLLISMPTSQAELETFECDQTAKSIQQAFTHFSHLLLLLDSVNLKQLRIFQAEFTNAYGSKLPAVDQQQNQKARIEAKFEEEFKLKVILDLFMKMLTLLNFDSAAQYDPSSHMIIYLPKFVEKFVQSLIKFENIFLHTDETAALTPTASVTRMSILGLVYSLLGTCEKTIKAIYKFKLNEKFFMQTDPILAQKASITESSADARNAEESKVSTLTKIPNKVNFLVRNNTVDQVDFADLLLEKCWFNLLHYAFKYRATLGMLGSIRDKQLNELDMLIILIERRIHQFPCTSISTCSTQKASFNRPLKYAPIQKKGKIRLELLFKLC